MSYNSYKKASSRPFDHLYDKNFRCNLQRFNRLNVNATQKTAQICIIPCYFSMFSNGLRNFYLKSKNPLPIDTTDFYRKEKAACFTSSFNANLFRNAPKFIDCNAETAGIKLNEISASALKTYRSIQSQTKYRESETQTIPFLPDAKIRKGEQDIPEIVNVNFCSDNQLTVDEVLIESNLDKIDRARARRNFEKSLKKDLSTSLQGKLKQLEVYEWSEYLYREKEINVTQNERLQHVISSLSIRQKAIREIAAETVRNVKCQSVEQLQMKKRALQLKFQRKLRKVSRAYGRIKNEDLIASKNSQQSALKLSNESDVFEVNNSDCNAVAVFKKYVEHKNQVEKKLRIIYNALLPRQVKNESPKCVVRKKVKEIKCNDLYDSKDSNDDYINRIEIKRVLKGKATQMKMRKEKHLRIHEILAYQNLFPLKCAQRGSLMQNVEKSYKKISEETRKENELKVMNFLNEILHDVNVIIRDSFNQKLLKEAEELRKQRANERKTHELEIESSLKICEKIQDQLNQLHEDITKEVLKKIVPVAIELIAEREAQNFISKNAKNSIANSSNVHDQVKEILINDLVPHIVQKMSTQNDQLCALLASNDAFDDFLEQCFPNEK